MMQARCSPSHGSLTQTSRLHACHSFRTFSLLVSLALLLGACTGSSNPRSDGSRGPGRPSSADEFEAELEPLCDELQAKSDELNASTKEELERLSQEFIDAQAAFIARASELTPPSSIESEFESYLSSSEEFIELNKRSVAGSDSRRDSLALSLDAAEEGAKLFEFAEKARLPESCPPSSGGDVYGFLFVAQANVACFNLGTELDRLGVLEVKTDTRKESAELLKFLQALATELAAAIKKAVPPEVGDADVDRMVRLYERSADLMSEIRRGFVEKNEQLYESALRKQQEAARAADRLAHSFGLHECVNFIGTDGT